MSLALRARVRVQVEGVGSEESCFLPNTGITGTPAHRLSVLFEGCVFTLSTFLTFTHNLSLSL